MVCKGSLTTGRACLEKYAFRIPAFFLQGAELSQGENYSKGQVSGKYVMSECIVR